MHLRTIKAKLTRESFELQLGNNGSTCGITLHARVLGKGKGTPMLKNGIKCVDKFPDPDETDVNSDWQGFE